MKLNIDAPVQLMNAAVAVFILYLRDSNNLRQEEGVGVPIRFQGTTFVVTKNQESHTVEVQENRNTST